MKYTTIQNIRYSYSINPGDNQNASYVTKSVPDIKLPWQKIVRESTSIDDVWMTLELNNYDEETLETSLVTIQPGESAVIAAKYSLSLGIHTSTTFTPIDLSLYECRLYLDNDFDKYISADLTSWQSGVQLYYTISNNTDKVVDLSRVTFGMWESEYTDVYAFQWYITGVQYRIFSDAQQAAQAVVDSIDKQTEEITGSIQDQTDQITDSLEQQTEKQKGFFAELGDRISGFFSSLTSSLGGFFTSLGDRIGGFFDNFLSGILDGLKNLFVPNNEYFTEYFDQWDTWMTEHFGALYYPFDLMLDMLNRFLTLDVPDRPTITFPAIEVMGYKLTDAVEVDIRTAFAGDGWFHELFNLYDLYQTVVTVIFVFGLANLARRKLNSIMGGGE